MARISEPQASLSELKNRLQTLRNQMTADDGADASGAGPSGGPAGESSTAGASSKDVLTIQSKPKKKFGEGEPGDILASSETRTRWSWSPSIPVPMPLRVTNECRVLCDACKPVVYEGGRKRWKRHRRVGVRCLRGVCLIPEQREAHNRNVRAVRSEAEFQGKPPHVVACEADSKARRHDRIPSFSQPIYVLRHVTRGRRVYTCAPRTLRSRYLLVSSTRTLRAWTSYRKHGCFEI